MDDVNSYRCPHSLLVLPALPLMTGDGLKPLSASLETGLNLDGPPPTEHLEWHEPMPGAVHPRGHVLRRFILETITLARVLVGQR